MTLPSIAHTLTSRHLSPEACDDATAKAIVYDAIRTDLADGLSWLKDRAGYNWKVIPEQEECCIHCQIKDIPTRKQVVRLASYTGLRAFVAEELGIHIALHNFRPLSNDGGPSGRIAIEPVTRHGYPAISDTTPGSYSLKPSQSLSTYPSQLKLSPARSWQVMSWGATEHPSPCVSEAEAAEHIWEHVQTNCAEGLAFLRNQVERNISAESDLSNAPGELIGQMIQLVGVPGIQQVVAKKLGVPGFLFYNCCKTGISQGSGTGRHAEEFSWRIQLLNQASEEMMDC